MYFNVWNRDAETCYRRNYIHHTRFSILIIFLIFLLLLSSPKLKDIHSDLFNIYMYKGINNKKHIDPTCKKKLVLLFLIFLSTPCQWGIGIHWHRSRCGRTSTIGT